MKKDILMIHPWIYDFAAYDFWIKPMGLLYWTAVLRNNGHNLQVMDCLNPFHPDIYNERSLQLPKRKHVGRGKYPKERINKPDVLKDFPRRFYRYGITPSLYREELKKLQRPDLIMVTSMMTYWYPGVYDAIELARDTFQGVPVILGGSYVSLCPDHAMRSGADVTIGIVTHEKICAILGDLLGGPLIFKPKNDNLDSWPYPAYDLLPYLDQVPLLTSRGCPFRCGYCASHLLYPGFVQRDPDKVYEEIVFWHRRYNIRHFSFYDDALLFNQNDLIVPLLQNLIESRLSCKFHCPNGLHVRYISEDLGRMMFQAGFRTIRLGFETSDPLLQSQTGGKVSNMELKNAIRNLKKAGYQGRDIGVYLLCGLPDQKASEVYDSIRFVCECGAKPVIAEFSPIPGTPLWEEAVRVSPYPIDREPLFQNKTLLPCQSSDLTYEMYQGLKRMARESLPDDTTD